MMPSSIPPRLHVLLAAQANVGIVIRRGPSKQFCTLLWDRATDTFTLGQWLKGRIYEHCCDLSPDGKYFLYFAMNARRSRIGPLCWTAVSRAPYLKALALYGEEETWVGGGHFINNKKYTVNLGVFFQVIRQSTEVEWQKPNFKARALPIDEVQSMSKYPIGNLGMYCHRLEREGWLLTTGAIKHHFVFEKPLNRNWLLKVLLNNGNALNQLGKGSTWGEYTLINLGTREQHHFPDWEWADLDRSRLVWAAKGQIWAASLDKNGLRDEKMLYDFNDMRFEAIKAPYD